VRDLHNSKQASGTSNSTADARKRQTTKETKEITSAIPHNLLHRCNATWATKAKANTLGKESTTATDKYTPASSQTENETIAGGVKHD